MNHIAAALYQAGVRPGQAVGLVMDNHPDCLTALAALSRLGAVAVLLNPAMRGAALPSQAMQVTGVKDVIVAPPSQAVPDLLDACRAGHRLLIGSPNLPAHPDGIWRSGTTSIRSASTLLAARPGPQPDGPARWPA